MDMSSLTATTQASFDLSQFLSLSLPWEGLVPNSCDVSVIKFQCLATRFRRVMVGLLRDGNVYVDLNHSIQRVEKSRRSCVFQNTHSRWMLFATEMNASGDFYNFMRTKPFSSETLRALARDDASSFKYLTSSVDDLSAYKVLVIPFEQVKKAVLIRSSIEKLNPEQQREYTIARLQKHSLRDIEIVSGGSGGSESRSGGSEFGGSEFCGGSEFGGSGSVCGSIVGSEFGGSEFGESGSRSGSRSGSEIGSVGSEIGSVGSEIGSVGSELCGSEFGGSESEDL